jgi:hypothetical protein
VGLIAVQSAQCCIYALHLCQGKEGVPELLIVAVNPLWLAPPLHNVAVRGPGAFGGWDRCDAPGLVLGCRRG